MYGGERTKTIDIDEGGERNGANPYHRQDDNNDRRTPCRNREHQRMWDGYEKLFIRTRKD